LTVEQLNDLLPDSVQGVGGSHLNVSTPPDAVAGVRAEYSEGGEIWVYLTAYGDESQAVQAYDQFEATPFVPIDGGGAVESGGSQIGAWRLMYSEGSAFRKPAGMVVWRNGPLLARVEAYEHVADQQELRDKAVAAFRELSF
jgi:hypothetical protein